jgi:hypothetical protein
MTIPSDLFYDIRNLKNFSEFARCKNKILHIEPNWDGNEVWICCNNERVFSINSDIRAAYYIIMLHNMSMRLFKEVESKYEHS